MTEGHRTWLAAAVLAAVLLVTWLIYLPGLRGGFLFDDYATLSPLSDYGSIATLDEAKRFVTDGRAGPAGRPISLATFLLDKEGWPSDATPFKRTNVLLHMLCGLAIAWLALLCARALRWNATQGAWLAALSASIWLLHPLWVSTTLYVVQRMTILSALFQLLGLACYVDRRIALADADREQAITIYATATLLLALFTALAFFSKENGALLPTLALVLEATVLRNTARGANRRWFDAWASVVLGLPTVLILGYLAHAAVTAGADSEVYRGFTIPERLLTESRVLLAYLFALAIPRMETSGVYHDDLMISSGLLQPWTTVFCCVGILGMLAGAFWARSRWPLLACSILFFFAAHLLESTTIPLELYFEHRNYLAAAFLAIAAAGSLVAVQRSLGASAAIPATALTFGILALLTSQRASLWGNRDEMLLFWAQKQPGSERTQLEAAQVHLRRREFGTALQTLDLALATHPSSVSLLTVKLVTACGMKRDTVGDVEHLRRALEEAPYGPNTYRTLERLFRASGMGACASVHTDDWEQFAEALSHNPSVIRSPTATQQALFLRGLAALKAGRDQAAAAAFSQALEVRYEFEAGMRMVSELASCDVLGEAVDLLRKVRQHEDVAHDTSRIDSPQHDEEIDHIGHAIDSEMSEPGAANRHPCREPPHAPDQR